MPVRGDWRPGGFPPVITLVIKLVLFGMMTVRGADYFFGDSVRNSSKLTEIEAAAPLQMWGIICVIAALAGFTGVLMGRGSFVLWGHIGGAALYASFSVGILFDVIHRAENPGAGVVPAVLFTSLAVFFLITSKLDVQDNMVRIGLAAFFFTVAISVTTIGLDGLRSATLLLGIATVHLMMALGTAARQRQVSILKKRGALRD